MEFTHYENPKQARRVWFAYSSDISRYGLAREAEAVFNRSSSADSLDIGLHMIISDREVSQQADKGIPYFIDSSDGSWSNVVRTFEDD